MFVPPSHFYHNIPNGTEQNLQTSQAQSKILTECLTNLKHYLPTVQGFLCKPIHGGVMTVARQGYWYKKEVETSWYHSTSSACPSINIHLISFTMKFLYVFVAFFAYAAATCEDAANEELEAANAEVSQSAGEWPCYQVCSKSIWAIFDMDIFFLQRLIPRQPLMTRLQLLQLRLRWQLLKPKRLSRRPRLQWRKQQLLPRRQIRYQ